MEMPLGASLGEIMQRKFPSAGGRLTAAAGAAGAGILMRPRAAARWLCSSPVCQDGVRVAGSPPAMRAAAGNLPVGAHHNVEVSFQSGDIRLVVPSHNAAGGRGGGQE